MTGNEFKSILAVLTATYKNFVVTDETKAKIWYEMLGDIDYNVLKLAVQKHVAETEFPPTIASLRKAASSITNPEIEMLNAGAAWEEVKDAIRKFGMNREVDALNSMSLLTKSAVKAMTWRELCLSENQMADRAHFLKIFDAYKDREKKEALMPPSVRAQIEHNTEKFKEAGVKQLISGIAHSMSTGGNE
jgi:hypothetical protein